MSKFWILIAGLLLALIVLAPGGETGAQADTPTATYNNSTRQMYATIPYQSNCNPLQPCGALPWPVPKFATISLPSPTFIYIYAEAATSTGTVTPVPTATPMIDVGPVSTFGSDIQTMGARFMQQSTAVVVIAETPVTVNEIAAGLGGLVGGPFGFFRQVIDSLGSLGLIGTVLKFAFFALMFVLFVRVALALFPVVRFAIQFGIQIIGLFKP